MADKKYIIELTENEAKEIIGNRWLKANRIYLYIEVACFIMAFIVAVVLNQNNLSAWYSLLLLIPFIVAYTKSRNGCRKHINDKLSKLE